MNLATLKRNLKKDVSALPTVKVTLLGDNPTQLLFLAIKGYGIEEGLNIDLFETEYNQIDREIFNVNSDLYIHQPRYIVIFQSSEKLLLEFYKTPHQQRTSFAADHIEKVEEYIQMINGHLKANILYFNFPEINDNVFGNYSNKIPSSFLFQLRKINYELMNLAGKHGNFFINDVSALQNQFGRSFAFSPTMYANSGMVHSLDYLPYVAKNLVDIIKSAEGKIKKCVILDLDNTLWGGIIGDDGMENIQIGNLGIGEVFTKWQMWFKELKERGIIIAVCSKNNEETAMEPFRNHTDMVLRLEDIAVFVANWDNKADNIRHIQSILNIGFDSMVFIDDNPAERKIVRENIPDISVPDLPEDPAEYLSYLQRLNLFETASFTEEDSDRTRQYQEESKRAGIKKKYVNEDDFLKSLNMTAIVEPFSKMDIPRIAQLTQRSNQFNLRTIRYTDEDIQRIRDDKDFYTLSFKLSDEFGDYGLVSVIILKKTDKGLFIDTWIMSCRVLKRGLEQLVLNEIVELARNENIPVVIGEYIPTKKNSMVSGHYSGLGFKEQGDKWNLMVDDYSPNKHFIQITRNN